MDEQGGWEVVPAHSMSTVPGARGGSNHDLENILLLSSRDFLASFQFTSLSEISILRDDSQIQILKEIR